MEGNPSDIMEMKTWLQKIGSPMSRIDKVMFSNDKQINDFTFEHFKVAH